MFKIRKMVAILCFAIHTYALRRYTSDQIQTPRKEEKVNMKKKNSLPLLGQRFLHIIW